jgi:glycosyltransferase involved in cell wall biosynthesis
VTSEGSIAVVIPARNTAGLIERALESVWSQKRPPDEVIVVDDGSTDDTAERVRRCGNGIVLIESPPQGVASARNAGVKAAVSDFIAFLDSDDYWAPQHLASMHAAITATDGCASLYFSDMELAPEYGGGTIWSQSGVAIEGSLELRQRDKTWLFASRQPMLIQATVISRAAYEAVGGSDPRLTRRSDTHLIFKVGIHGPLCAVAGIAGTRTADDASSLTHIYFPEHLVYDECTASLYGDVLSRYSSSLAEEDRHTLAGRAAQAHLSLARRSGIRRPLSFAAHVVAASRYDKSALIASALRTAVKGPRSGYSFARIPKGAQSAQPDQRRVRSD